MSRTRRRSCSTCTNTRTSAASPYIKSTSIAPPLPYKLLSTNPDGSTNVYDEALFVSRGNLYATFDAITINFSALTTHTVIPAALYRINPATGLATMITATAQNLDSALDLGGTVYAFDVAANQVVTLDPATGNTAFFSNYDPAVGLIEGVAATPEPASITLAGLGLGVFIFLRRRNAVLGEQRTRRLSTSCWMRAALGSTSSLCSIPSFFITWFR